MTSPREVFTAAFLLDQAGEGALARGAVYEREGRARITLDDGSRVEAIVRGTEPYAVALWVEQGRPGWFCACPAASDGSLCKHAVATALAVSGGSSEHALGTPDVAASSPLEPPGPLADADVGTWGKRVTRAFAAGGRLLDYRNAPGWAAGVHEVLDDLQRLLDAGHAGAVLKLAEQAHKRAETALNRIDDSDGWLTDIAHRIAQLHQRAADRARPKPRPFAERLFDLETGSHTLDTFHRAAATYADVLGAGGLDRYRELATNAWASADHQDRYGRTFRIRQARIGVAIGSRDPDELIEVKRDDLHSPYDHLEIVQLLAQVGRDDDAIAWARRGLEEFADRWHQTPRLRDALADLLIARDDPGGVEALYWDAYVRRPSLTGYVELIEHATDPDAARRRAIQHLRARVGTPVGDGRFAYPADTLVQILHHDGRDDEAWATMAEHGCDHDLAMQLAERREADHPLDAITIYDRDVEQLIDRKGRAAYRAAVRQLGHIHTLATRAGHPEIFETILERARSDHRRKRTLMALLDAANFD